MSDYSQKVERGQTATLSVVDGALVLEGGTVVSAPGIDSVHGDLHIRQSSTVKGSLKAESVRGDGDLQVEGDLEAEDVRLDDGASLGVRGNLKAERVDVPNELEVGGKTDVEDLRVGGTALLSGDAVAEDVKVGGKLKAALTL